MSQDPDSVLDGVAWEGEDLATAIAIGVRSAEDVNEIGGALLRDLDHQTTNAGGNELNVIADLHFLSLYHASQD